ncbi:MAG: tetratricopeptide repeat protein [Treponema sp.]|nr:tetratricopeptide repeat protein [Treponema sp.]
MKKNIFVFGILFFLISCAFSESEGEKLFKTNNPGGAVTLLEKDISDGNVSADTYNFLGLSYFQLGQYEKAIDAFERGMNSGVSNRKLLSFNEGNVAYAAGNYSKAESCYSLALAASPDFYSALLNRANTRLMMKKYQDCLADYKRFVLEQPDDSQTPEIQRLIGYLEQEIQRQEEEAVRLAEEQKRLEEENKRLQEEMARQKAEQEALEAERRAAEEERRRKLLEDVANSLQQTDTTNMTAGAEDVLDYDYESELE